MRDRSPLSLAAGSLDLPGLGSDPADRLRAALAWAAGAGLSGVLIDATRPGLRPRDLDRSGRREIAALLRRHQLAFVGLDLPVPPEHFSSPAHAERALSAAHAAAALAAELHALTADIASPALRAPRAPIALELPAGAPAALRAELARAAEHTGVWFADAGPARTPQPDASPATPPTPSNGPLRDAIDVGRALLDRLDPAAAVARSGPRLALLRLAEVTNHGPIPIGVPPSRLDVLALRIALETSGAPAAVVLDLTGIADPAAACASAHAAWDALPALGQLAGRPFGSPRT
ncbi:MAG: hypothetical protein C0513_08805 [Isosphaera sp.]|nr:hypothetical protein [Isosphaera sp.]